MFEITYQENDFHAQGNEDAHYDFTFENRYDIFHRPKGKVLEYITLDRTTGRTSLIMGRKSPIDASDYPHIIPQILYSVKYNGDQRYKGAGAYQPADLIDMIFRTVLPLYGYLNVVKHNGGRNFKARAEYFHLLKEGERLNRKLLSMLAKYKLKSCEDACNVRIGVTKPMSDTIQKLTEVLQTIGGWSAPQGTVGSNTASHLVEKLTAFLVREENEERLAWISYDKATGIKSLCCMPTDLKESLRNALWTACNTHFALTSGTMMDDTGFSFFKDELGIIGCLDKYSVSEFSCGSPFDYGNHTRLYISENTPLPDMKDPEYIPAVAKEIIRLVRATHGHTAVLFTSYKALNAVYELVKDELKEYPLIKMSRSNKNAIAQFKQSGNGVLFASGSMWEGVDCAGDILSSVIIVRLPFPLRTQTMELKKRACANTGEFVQRYAVPQMIIKLRQGAGRLIRNETDTGVLSILDARAAKGGTYRHRVLTALSKYPLVRTVFDVRAFIDEVKDEKRRASRQCGCTF